MPEPRPSPPPDAPATGVRADIWLWAARFHKSRALAAAACKGGKVHRGGRALKPASPLRPGDELTLSLAPCARQIRVLALMDRRVSASLAAKCFADLTDPALLAAARDHARHVGRPAGGCRPTKRERRQTDALLHAFRAAGHSEPDIPATRIEPDTRQRG